MNAVTEVMDELRKALAELEDCRARNADLRTMLEQVTRERDEWRDKYEALAVLVDGYRRERDEARASLAQIRRVFGNAIAFDDARGDIVKMAEIAYRGACDGDKAVGELQRVERERDEARAEAEKLSESAKAAWEAECVMRDQRDRYHAEWKQERQEVERLRETKDYLRTWLSSEELEGLRVKAAEHPLLWEEIHHLKAEVERLREKYDSVLEANVGLLDGAPYVDARAAFRRGAEAMREACQQWCLAWENDGEAIADALADLRVEE